jgi:hypothetical protein
MYNKYYKEKLLITTSIYDLYLLVIITREVFGIVGMQTNNILFSGTSNFQPERNRN